MSKADGHKLQQWVNMKTHCLENQLSGLQLADANSQARHVSDSDMLRSDASWAQPKDPDLSAGSLTAPFSSRSLLILTSSTELFKPSYIKYMTFNDLFF